MLIVQTNAWRQGIPTLGICVGRKFIEAERIPVCGNCGFLFLISVAEACGQLPFFIEEIVSLTVSRVTFLVLISNNDTVQDAWCRQDR